MKSIVCHGPRDLRVEETELPGLGAGDVLIGVEAGGICGSDLHYYHDGGFGAVKIQHPMVLGHEVSGRILEVGEGVSNVAVGDLVAVNPSVPCGECEYCKKAMYNHCLDMRFYGSAMRVPHVHGAFSQKLVAKGSQCFAFAAGTKASSAAFSEPFSVALHAVGRLGPLIGKRVLVTGAGPIGALVVVAAKLHGALEVVATDIVDEALERVIQLGADKAINVGRGGNPLAVYGENKGYFDAVVECSGSQPAIVSALDVVRPKGRVVQLALGGDLTIPQNTIVTKEIELCGSFRFYEDFAWAVELIGSGRVDLSPLLTQSFPLEDVVAAFELASDRKKAMKVQIRF
nr:L-idonate 5-dehydrogenase [uncultured Cohaesibacter sp.]